MILYKFGGWVIKDHSTRDAIELREDGTFTSLSRIYYFIGDTFKKRKMGKI